MKSLIFLFVLLLITLVSCFPGEIQEINLGNADEHTKQLLSKSTKLATSYYNSKANHYNFHAVFNIEKLQSQIVSGRKLYITIVLAVTNCLNRVENYGKTLAECGLKKDSMPLKCVAEVWVREWLDDMHVTSMNCESSEVQMHSNVHHILGTDQHNIGTREQFDDFIAAYQKSYKDDKHEYERRYNIFHTNMKRAYILQLTDQGDATYGATQFADLSEEEFSKMYLSPIWKPTNIPTMKQAPLLPLSDAPTSFDWRNHNSVTPVKNQGQCGSCWAFSTTGNIEGQWAIKKMQLLSLSEQQLVDCDKVDLGCNGGLPSQAYQEIIRMGGLNSETDYPYKAEDGSKCLDIPSKFVIHINGSLNISSDEGQMAAWCAANGPISIGINAAAMQFYFGGISHPWKIFCSHADLDHGVLIVGYDVKGSEPYWIVKNSWGASWGEKGYYLVYRGDGTCGLNTMCTSAIVM